MNYLKVGIVLCILYLATAQHQCNTKKRCDECIQEKQCSWCYDQIYQHNRCNIQRNHDFQECNAASNPKSRTTITSNTPLNIEPKYNKIQISPQKAKMSLRVGESQVIPVQFIPTDNPVDLYYLMDLSNSMKRIKNQLSMAGREIASAMLKMTTNFRIGFGSFVDKPVMPYASTTKEKLRNPCSTAEPCEPTYSYKHTMKLSDNATMFETLVSEAKTSGNIDQPEGGFDGLLQAMVCTNEVGWREKARKLLVFSTDENFHVAGDGKLGGIVEPNDGLCHLENNMYTKALEQDYPSVSQINYKAQQNSINIIFAVSSDTKLNVYRELSKNVAGASAGKLDASGADIVNFIQKEYENIRSTVQFQHDNAHPFLSVHFQTSCNSQTGRVEDKNTCKNVKDGETLYYNAIVTATAVPAEKHESYRISVYPQGFKQVQGLDIDVEVLSTCNCSHSTHHTYQESSAVCKHHGDLVCGTCECHEGYYGNNCDCETAGGDAATHQEQCSKDNSNEICSSRGRCKCGQCECYKDEKGIELYTGTYCECDNRNCKKFNKKLCGGVERGLCECGVCVCNPEYTGEKCECPVSDELCIEPGQTKVCSDRGTCECGECVCESVDDVKYGGKYCEEEPTPGGKGFLYKDCVLCTVFNTGPLKSSGCKQCETNVVKVKGELKVENPGERIYTHEDTDGCKYKFVYNNKGVIRVQAEKECPVEVNPLVIALSVAGGVVLCGLLALIMWKIATTVHDRREFTKFQKETAEAFKHAACENPIHEKATTEFQNPIHQKAST